MYELLTSYLEDNASQEQAAKIINACQALVECGVTDHMVSIDLELSSVDSETNDAVFKIEHNVLRPLFISKFLEFGLTVNAEANIGTMAELFRWLYLVPNFDDPATLNDLSRLELEPAEVLAEILSVVSGKGTEEMIDLIDDASEELIKRIREITHLQAQEILENTEVRPHMYERVKVRVEAYLKAAPPQAEAVKRLFEQHYRLCTPALLLQEASAEYFSTLQPKALATELLGVLLMSDLPDEHILVAAGHEFDHLIERPMDITGAYVVLKNLYSRVTESIK